MCLSRTGFAAKPRLALAMIVRAIAANAPFAWVAADTVYGVGEIEKALRRAGKGYVLGVPGNHLFRSWRKRPPIAGMASEIAHALDPSLWKRLSAGEGTKGARLHDWAYCELADLDAAEYDDQRTGPWTRGLLIRRNIADGDMAFFSTWCPAEPASKSWSRSKDIAGRSKIALRRLRTNSGSTTMKRAPGTAGIVTSRSSCSPSP